MTIKERQLFKRLLRLFPVKNLQSYVEDNPNQEHLIEKLTAQLSKQDIFDLIMDNYMYTRQHIYLFEKIGRWKESFEDNFVYEILNKRTDKGERILLALPEITYNVILLNPLESTQLTFLQPVVIHVKSNHIAVHLTKMERTVAKDFPTDRNPVKTGQVNKEDDIINKITNYFKEELSLNLLDLNKGVKYLWSNNYIDSAKVQHRDTSSVVLTTMDEKMLFKEIYPEKFREIMLRPLMKTHFKNVTEEDHLCDHFEIDSCNGIINIPIFAKNEKQVNYVVSKILEHN